MDHTLAKTIFERIRAQPYQVPTKAGEITPQCATKSYELVGELAMLGYTVRIRIAEMDWYDSPIPREIIDLHPKDRPITHYYPEVLIDGDWRLIDPSVDPELAEKGFRMVGFEGDLRSCFTLTRIYAPDEQLAFASLWEDEDFIIRYFEDVGPFLRGVSRWITEARRS